MDVSLDLNTQTILVEPHLSRLTMATRVQLSTITLHWKESGDLLAIEGMFLPTEQIRVNPQGLRTEATNNIRAGIIAYGTDQELLVPIRAGIKSTFDIPIRAGIAEDNLTAPQNAFAYHLGQGAVLITWEAPTDGTPDYYEVYTALQSAGPYSKQQMGEFTGLRGVVFNVPIGVNVYFRVRAAKNTGATGPFVQVKQGKVQQQTVTMSIRAIEGSIIQANALFSMLDPVSGRMVVVKAPEEIEVVSP